ncbi:hypothetical protein PAT3040_05161 [Paenibacillus agaridevorans]|uniref:Uncharacterized protein n=1 Tax=Paenibacillus agaridevorans TaxID=171404 RepID=A0A2R5EZB7_9BACL|nr:hypothetical protein [Paenibacillus agaridevorans]GBG10428.1 hypothetical protein PAT3040_05161 [Paenibacillus agaridevorans]
MNKLENHLNLSGRPTPDELVMIRDFITYPHIINMIQKSQEDMGFAHIALKGVIIRCLEFLLFKATNDFYVLKRELKSRNIKVVEEDTNDGILYFRYFCRGYDDKFGIVRETLRTEIVLRMTKYTNEIAKQLKM